MNKSELIEAIASDANVSKADAGRALDAFIKNVTSTLAKRGNVAISGFGSFQTRDRAARKGINPRNPSETINIPAATVPAFKPGKQLKEAVNK